VFTNFADAVFMFLANLTNGTFQAFVAATINVSFFVIFFLIRATFFKR
jgi:hypothetical protein